jgi:hypothetical protein
MCVAACVLNIVWSFKWFNVLLIDCMNVTINSEDNDRHIAAY